MYEYLATLKQKRPFVSIQATLSPEEQEEFDAWRRLYNKSMLEGDLIDVALPDLPVETYMIEANFELVPTEPPRLLNECMLASEPSLAKEWDTPEEDEAWKDL